ncbi:MAG: hypothetical protein AB1810_07160 [Pseudomonadota bacterium]
MKFRIVLVVLAALLIAAHFLRQGNLVLVAVCLSAPLFLLIHRQWSMIALQAMLYAAAGIWIFVLLHLIELRAMAGRPWGVAALILGVVALYTALTGVLLNSRDMRQRYR